MFLRLTIIWVIAAVWLRLGLWGQSHHPTQTIKEYWDAVTQQWVPEQLSTFTYSEQGTLVATQHAYWDEYAHQWRADQAFQRVYDESGQLVQQKVQHIRAQNTAIWRDKIDAESSTNQHRHHEIERDVRGRILYQRIRIADGRTGRLTTLDSLAYEYDPSIGDEPAQVLHYEGDGSGVLIWQETIRHTYIYDKQGHLVYQRDERNQREQQAWERLTEYYYSYDEALGQTRAITIQHGDAYIATKQVMTHDPDGHLLRKWHAFRYAPTDDWQPLFEQRMSYDLQGYLLQKKAYTQWVSEARAWSECVVKDVDHRIDGKVLSVKESQQRFDPYVGIESATLLSECAATYTYDPQGRPLTYVRRQLVGDTQQDIRLRYTYAQKASPQAVPLKLHPNPTHTTLHISIPEHIRLVPGTLTVADLTGRTIWENEIDMSQSRAFQLSVKNWKPGYYLLTFSQDGQKFIGTFMKQ